jgi:hypothetical protein
VRGADDLVVVPAIPVAILPGPVFPGHDAVAVGERVDVLAEEEQAIKKVAHRIPASCLRNESPV